MPIVIQELSAEITPDQGDDNAGTVQPAEGASQSAILNLIELAREREARLAVD